MKDRSRFTGREFVPVFDRKAGNGAATITSDSGVDLTIGETEAPQTTRITTEPVVSPVKSTGIGLLDRNLNGGLPAGTVVYFSADPGSMAEVFLYQLSSSKKTYYFTTSRRPTYLNQNITDMNFDTGNIAYVDIYSQYYIDNYGEMVENTGNEYSDRDILDFTEHQLKALMSLGDDFNIVIDNFSFYLNLNVNKGAIIKLANVIYEVTKETGCLTFLYVLGTGNNFDAEGSSVEHNIMNLCDAVFEVVLERTGDKVANQLYIPKIRGQKASNSLIKFKVDEGIQIDTSRDIA